MAQTAAAPVPRRDDALAPEEARRVQAVAIALDSDLLPPSWRNGILDMGNPPASNDGHGMKKGR
ncbi:hypothetical protein [Stenotrophomonas sp. MMGLT7]|uniref:hypothetical protein n=1 Tax=Stenotrophomonas sp. MMGLT7 TaxID=2901227 RepID=UPI001E316231|nr:hypothetical protein [Stenotrophomonas sp. MMGLT7]MCD7097340.1 hypothetical protein [Stenotrophomonas sp. MMGLT7]